ncbi:MAG TPA: prepilin peptidase [Aquifex aeolicus]|nr:prepilin peptidase [Aquifex aeolicus]
MILAFLFLLGTVLGSFYNVLTYRLPKGMSLLNPPSHCPRCKSKIRWYDNIPLVSYLLLRGKCRECGAPIPLSYPIVEFSSGALAVLSYLRWGMSVDALIMYALFSALIVISVIDMRHFIVPDRITLPGIALGLVSSPLRESFTFHQSLTGTLIGFLLPFLIYLYYVKFRKMEGLGFGDVKLLSMIGSMTGPYGVLSALFLGSAIGLVFALPLVIKNRSIKFAIPFGPFLSAGCFLGVYLSEFFLNDL